MSTLSYPESGLELLSKWPNIMYINEDPSLVVPTPAREASHLPYDPDHPLKAIEPQRLARTALHALWASVQHRKWTQSF